MLQNASLHCWANSGEFSEELLLGLSVIPLVATSYCAAFTLLSHSTSGCLSIWTQVIMVVFGSLVLTFRIFAQE